MIERENKWCERIALREEKLAKLQCAEEGAELCGVAAAAIAAAAAAAAAAVIGCC